MMENDTEFDGIPSIRIEPNSSSNSRVSTPDSTSTEQQSSRAAPENQKGAGKYEESAEILDREVAQSGDMKTQSGKQRKSSPPQDLDLGMEDLGGTGEDEQSDLLSPPSPTLPRRISHSRQQPPSPTNSRWSKIRTTVKVTNVVGNQVGKQRRRKASSLDRQDSFLKRFSTRHGGSTSINEDELGELDANKTKLQRVEQESRQCSTCVINPDENFMFYWLGIVTVAVLYNLWTPIAREAFPEIQGTYPYMWLATDAFCDLLYLIDIIVQLRTGYLERGLVVYESKKLATNYICSRFFAIDLCSLIPLDFLQFIIGIHPLIRFPRFLKVYRLYRFCYMVETRTIYPNMWRVANLSHILFLGSHWFAAFYFMISKAENFEGVWGYPHPEGEYSFVARKYLKSLYWSTLTLTTIGDLPPPESNWE